ncbi:MAG: YfhO family protein [Pyrinomonadaceae bacterium]
MTLPLRPRFKIETDFLAACGVTLLPLIYFFPATRGSLIIAPDDGVIFNIPMRVVVANLIHAGYLPLWNPYMFGGMPLFGAAQAGVLFPLNWFYLLFSIPLATNLMMLSTYALAALGAYLYARRSGAGIAGAVATSLIWQWSAFMVAKVGQTNVVQTAALLPWVLWAVDRYGMSGKRSRGVLLAVLVALQIFAGHQQTFVYSFLLAAAYTLVMVRASSGRERTSYLRSLVLLSAGVVLAAVQVLPTVELLRKSLRATASYDFFSSFSMPRRFVLTFFAPFIMGGGDGQLFRAPYIGPAFVGEYIAYVGAATLMLALVALLLKPDARTKFWAAVAVVCLTLAIGRFLPLNLYKLVYYVPVLNLFRVPARHLMEVEFALAVLAGRGLTAIASGESRAKALRTVTAVGALVFLLTCLTVSWWRPSNFKLGRVAPVTILRAPELFIPILIAGLSALAIWIFARHYERQFGRSAAFMFAVLILDLCLWGQASGWRLSPTRVHPLWSEPESVRLLRNLQRDQGNTPYRILTDVQPFFINTGRDEAEKFKLGEFMLSLQPDTYMMHGVENAAGYDGFGLTRYSKLADDMKLWGELTDPGRSVRGPGREFDILNVRYLLKQSSQGEARRRAAERSPVLSTPPWNSAPALIDLGGVSFGKDELGAPSLLNGERLVFSVPPAEANSIALVTSLAWAADVKDGEVVGYVRLRTEDGKKFEFQLRAGEHTSEWSHDRPDLEILHRRAPVATSSTVSDPAGNFESHTYVAQFRFPETVRVSGGEIEVAAIKGMPNLTLDVKRVSLLKESAAEPLRGEWVEKLPAREGEAEPAGVTDATSIGSGRWHLAAETDYLQIYENTRLLPRAWLTSAELVASEAEELAVIRSGKLPGGQSWEPLRTALVEAPTGINYGAVATTGSAEVTRHEPNRVEVKTESAAPAILVLSENHYPGWGASVDGQSVDVIRVNYNLRGVAVPAGSHLATFAYQPKSVLVGLVFSLLTLAALLLWWSRALMTQAPL